MYLLTLVHSLCDQLYDEPHLDGKDKDAAGEKVSQVSAKPYLQTLATPFPGASLAFKR